MFVNGVFSQYAACSNRSMLVPFLAQWVTLKAYALFFYSLHVHICSVLLHPYSGNIAKTAQKKKVIL